jgi:hypothetical protein
MFSAVHPTTDIVKILRHVRFVPIPDSRGAAITSLLTITGSAQHDAKFVLSCASVWLAALRLKGFGRKTSCVSSNLVPKPVDYICCGRA